MARLRKPVLLAMLAALFVGCRSATPQSERVELSVPIAAATVEVSATERKSADYHLELSTSWGPVASFALQWAEETDDYLRRQFEDMRHVPLVVTTFEPKVKLVIGPAKEAKDKRAKELQSDNGTLQLEKGELTYNATSGELTLWLQNASVQESERRVARVSDGLESADVLEQLVRADGTFPEQIRVTITFRR